MTIRTLLQHILPHHALSRFAGFLANSENPWLKSMLIADFLRRYPTVDLSEAAEPNVKKYKSFNEFFIRPLKKNARPINSDKNIVVSPADGSIAEIGNITHDRLLQAKGHDFSLRDLLGGDDTLAKTFDNGSFATIYLAPHNYHRVHIPYDGKLVATQFIPGKLFSVNLANAQSIPSLYSRNERLVCIMEHEQLGKVAVILVGAMIVGSIQLAFENTPVRADHPVAIVFKHPHQFNKGEELGHFKLGSTVILLFEKDKVNWNPQLQAGSDVKVGEAIGNIKHD